MQATRPETSAHDTGTRRTFHPGFFLRAGAPPAGKNLRMMESIRDKTRNRAQIPRMLKIPSFFLLSLLLVFPPSARAWDPLGHMLVMQIAEEEMTPKARQELDAAIARFNEKDHPDAPYDAITAGCWMDDARAKTKEFNAWHYVNLPFTPDGTPLPEGSAENPDVIWATRQAVGILEGKTEMPGIDKDQALVMLLHLAADIHQPLHTTQNNDFGGNRVHLANLKDGQSDLVFSKGGNLHYFWDSAYRREFRDGQVATAYAPPFFHPEAPVAGHLEARKLVAREAAELRKKYPPESFANLETTDPAVWAAESHAIGYNLAYGQLPSGKPIELTPEYVEASRAAAEARIALAGHRLAHLLNQLLDPAGS